MTDGSSEHRRIKIPNPREKNVIRLTGRSRNDHSRLQPNAEDRRPIPTTPEGFRELYNVSPEKYADLITVQNNQQNVLRETEVSHAQRCFKLGIGEEQFFLTVKDKVPAVPDNLVSLAHVSPVLCFAKVRIFTEDGILLSHSILPVLIAHGDRDSGGRHTVNTGMSMGMDSQKMYKKVNEFLQLSGLPPVAVFLSCDDVVSGIATYRWDQSPGVPLIGFSGGPNALSSFSGAGVIVRQLGMNNVLEIDVNQMERRGTTRHPFRTIDSDPTKKAMIEGLFTKDVLSRLKDGVMQKIRAVFKG